MIFRKDKKTIRFSDLLDKFNRFSQFNLIEDNVLTIIKVEDSLVPWEDFIIQVILVQHHGKINTVVRFIDSYQKEEYIKKHYTSKISKKIFQSFSHEFSTSLNCIINIA